jgi:hypothetical protein
MAQSTRQTFGMPPEGVLIESSDNLVRLLEARYAYETRLWELEQQFEVKAAKAREEYLAAVLEIHAFEANGNQHAHHPLYHPLYHMESWNLVPSIAPSRRKFGGRA